jgi:acyl carrier protein
MQVEQEVRQFVVDNFLFGKDGDTFSNGDSFLERGIINSLGILALISFVEKQYAFHILDEEVTTDNWDSVDRIAGFVNCKLAAAS